MKKAGDAATSGRGDGGKTKGDPGKGPPAKGDGAGDGARPVDVPEGSRSSGAPVGKKNAKAATERPGPGLFGYFGESVAELKKVTAPTRQETLQATVVTLALVVFFAVVLALFDAAFKRLMWSIL